ncbi:MAG: alpha/beta hydrolase [Actinomycetota bacterium]
MHLHPPGPTPAAASTHVVVLPGGAYGLHAEHEGEPVAAWLRSLGIGASVHHYPTTETAAAPLHPAPLESVRAAIAARRAAGDVHVGALGFSAGGHAAGLAALAPVGSGAGGVGAAGVPDFAILAYPVTSMQLPTHEGSRLALLGGRATPELRRETSLDALVQPSSPPMFLWHTAEDADVPVEHSSLLARALAANGVPHALHVFPRGGHGLGLVAGRHDGAAASWTDLCAAWLSEAGYR